MQMHSFVTHALSLIVYMFGNQHFFHSFTRNTLTTGFVKGVALIYCFFLGRLSCTIKQAYLKSREGK